MNYTTFKVGGQKFSSQIDPRTGTPCVSSIHPYDETEYHWARKSSDGSWTVYRKGSTVSRFGRWLALTEEGIAAKLLNLDKALHLQRTGGIW